MNLVVRSTRVPIAERSSRDEEVSLPVSGHGAVLGLSRSLADHHLRSDVAPGLAL